jgi:hypothetical protein
MRYSARIATRLTGALKLANANSEQLRMTGEAWLQALIEGQLVTKRSTMIQAIENLRG